MSLWKDGLNITQQTFDKPDIKDHLYYKEINKKDPAAQFIAGLVD